MPRAETTCRISIAAAPDAHETPKSAAPQSSTKPGDRLRAERAGRVIGTGRQRDALLQHQRLIEPRPGTATEKLGQYLQRVSMLRRARAIARRQIEPPPAWLRDPRALHLQPCRGVM